MPIFMLNLDEIKAHYLDGYISIIRHPYIDLYILNYTKKASKEAKWNEITLNSRGLIIDKKGNIISRPFRKFFELEQLPKDLIPKGKPIEILEKLDGTLGIMYWYNDKPYISTRGSFTSFQALRATDLLYKNFSHIFSKLNKNYTYLFEIIIPENRIVIDYGDKEDLYLIGVVDNETNQEISIYDYSSIFSLPKKIEISANFSLKELHDLGVDLDIEGFVIKYEDGFRIKLKSETYIKKFNFYTKELKIYALEKQFSKIQKSNFEKKIDQKDLKWLQHLEQSIYDLKNTIGIKEKDVLFKIIKNKILNNQFLFDMKNFEKKFIS